MSGLPAEEYVCQTSVLHNFRTVPYFPEGSGVSLHLARACVFGCFAAYYEYHRRTMTKHTYQDFTKIMLPILSLYIHLLIVLNILVAILSSVRYFEGEQSCGTKFGNFSVAFQTGVFHILYEGIGIFLCRYGIGLGSLRASLFVGMLWGIVSFLVFFIISCVICQGFILPKIDKYLDNPDGSENFHRVNELVFTLFTSYKGCLAIFYAVIWLAPDRYFYRRPAAYVYAKWNLGINIYWIVNGIGFVLSSRQGDYQDTLCTFTVLSLLLLIFIQPYAICRAFVVDSNYWQGLFVTHDNPTAGLSLQNDVDTATTLAEKVGSLDTVYLFKRQNVRVIHFGHLQIDHNRGYISGGYSRVYFGTMGAKTEVAIKVIYAMELSPYEIRSLCEEAQILNELKHLNIISCLGICVMPPALALVCEYCSYGSLYEFLHKPVDGKLFENKNDLLVKTDQGQKSMMGMFSAFDMMPLIHTIRGSVSSSFSSVFGKNTAANSESACSGRVSRGSRASFVGGAWSQGREVDGRSNGGSEASGKLSETEESFENSRSSWSARSSFASKNRRSGGGIGGVLSPLYQKSAKSDPKLTPLVGSSHEELSGAEEGRPLKKAGGNISLQHLKTTGDGTAYASHMEGPERTLQSTFGSQMPLVLKLKMLYECTCAIAFMHSKGFVHCDIKSLNFLVTSDCTIKLADMGDSRPLNSKSGAEPQALPSRSWAAPELLGSGINVRETYSLASDVYSLAIVLSEIVTLRIPFNGECDNASPSEWLALISNEAYRPDMSDGTEISIHILNIIRHGWRADPKDRCTASEMLDIMSRFYKQ